jgi:hypothetical protein
MTDEQQRKLVVEATGNLPALSDFTLHGKDAVKLAFADGQSFDFIARDGALREMAKGLLSRMSPEMRDDVINHVTRADG